MMGAANIGAVHTTPPLVSVAVAAVRRSTGNPGLAHGQSGGGASIGSDSRSQLYALGRNAGFVNVGTDHDTGAFAVASIRGWWHFEGRRLYPSANKILVAADGGASNGSRLRLWKSESQKFADQTCLSISVCNFSPGTRKWNKTEHRLFFYIKLAR